MDHIFFIFVGVGDGYNPPSPSVQIAGILKWSLLLGTLRALGSVCCVAEYGACCLSER